uniref:Clathrin_bdg domain-containing protein n=1 Tax=Parastrongyloides trichosuri TaxID=131310 RepID=A0A0N4ZPY2_PARTI
MEDCSVDCKEETLKIEDCENNNMDDEFADFETAPQASFPEDPWSDTSKEETINSSFGKFNDFEVSLKPSNKIKSIPSLMELLDDSTIFDFEINSSIDENIDNHHIYDLLKECDKDELSDDDLQYMSIWKDLRIIEATKALQFSLTKSLSYNSFLEALQMNAKKVVPNSLEFLSSYMPKSDVSNNNEVDENEETVLNRIEKTIPPVSFDWKEAGLLNPIPSTTESSSSELLDYEFLLKINNDKLSAENPTYSLQNDLYAFGLMQPGNSISLDSCNKMTNINDILPNTGTKKINKEIEHQELISYSSLSSEGKILYDSLPDYNFMLSNVLIFPPKDKN